MSFSFTFFGLGRALAVPMRWCPSMLSASCCRLSIYRNRFDCKNLIFAFMPSACVCVCVYLQFIYMRMRLSLTHISTTHSQRASTQTHTHAKTHTRTFHIFSEFHSEKLKPKNMHRPITDTIQTACAPVDSKCAEKLALPHCCRKIQSNSFESQKSTTTGKVVFVHVCVCVRCEKVSQFRAGFCTNVCGRPQKSLTNNCDAKKNDRKTYKLFLAQYFGFSCRVIRRCTRT